MNALFWKIKNKMLIGFSEHNVKQGCTTSVSSRAMSLRYKSGRPQWGKKGSNRLKLVEQSLQFWLNLCLSATPAFFVSESNMWTSDATLRPVVMENLESTGRLLLEDSVGHMWAAGHWLWPPVWTGVKSKCTKKYRTLMVDSSGLFLLYSLNFSWYWT